MALFLLLLWPIAELVVAIVLANAIGLLYTVLLLLASWPIGILAVRSQGRAVWRRFAEAAGAGRPPTKEVVDGALVVLGGTLMLIPGFITDFFGLVLLVPFTRVGIRKLVFRNFRSRFLVSAIRFAPTGAAYDVDSTAHDIDQPRLGA